MPNSILVIVVTWTRIRTRYCPRVLRVMFLVLEKDSQNHRSDIGSSVSQLALNRKSLHYDLPLGNSDTLSLMYQSKADTSKHIVICVRHIAVHFLLSSTAIESQAVTQVHGRTDQLRQTRAHSRARMDIFIVYCSDVHIEESLNTYNLGHGHLSICFYSQIQICLFVVL